MLYVGTYLHFSYMIAGYDRAHKYSHMLQHHMAIFEYYWVAQVVPMLIILAIKILDKLKAGSELYKCENPRWRANPFLNDGVFCCKYVTSFSVFCMLRSWSAHHFQKSLFF